MQDWKRKKSLVRPARYEAELSVDEHREFLNALSTLINALIAYARSNSDPVMQELTGIQPGHSSAPEDPALARLLPNAQKEEDEEFEGANDLWRTMNEVDIIRAKMDNLMWLSQALQDAENNILIVEEDKVPIFIAAVNDLMIYLAEQPPTYRVAQPLRNWLSVVQSSLLKKTMPEIAEYE